MISLVQEEQANQLSVDVYKAECWMDTRGHGRGCLISQQVNSILKMLITVKLFSTICPLLLYQILDEAGFKLPDVSKPNYRHAPKGLPCIEIARHLDAPNVTLQLLIGLDGIMFADIVDSNTGAIEFLNFFEQAMDARQPNGNPAMMFRDHVLLDNHSANHGAAGFTLGQPLDTQSVEMVYTPVYSPELNSVEYAFKKMKKMAKQENIRSIFAGDVHASIYACLNEISQQDIAGFYRETGYISI